MILEIPIDSQQTDHEFSIELERVVYLLRFQFNFRANRWTMTVKAENGDVLVAGVPLVVNWPLLNRFRKTDLPPGTFFVMDSSGNDSEPTELSFGSTHKLLYAESTT